MSESNLQSMGDLASWAKRRGFIFQSSEVYGGLGSCWDYGPLGVELKNNLKNSWWRAMTNRRDVEGIDAAILMHPQVWKASGHVDNFCDPLVDCKQCKARFRADNLDLTKACPHCGTKGSFTAPRAFNLMFATQMGAVEDTASTVYLRPETAQGIFVNFINVQQTMRKKIPFGIAQVGKAFRNEITPGNFIFRMREFEQMEMQYFIRPGTQKEFLEVWKQDRWHWHLANGLRPEMLQWAPHPADKLAHYADAAVDIEYRFPHGWGEMEGIHSRTDFDLKQHQLHSGKSLQYVDQGANNEKYLPFVIETSVGLDRCFLAILCDAYRTENPQKENEEERTVLRLRASLAPIKAAVMPLMKKEELVKLADGICSELQTFWRVEYDEAGSIGKRYRRQDEIGTPFCLTVDYDSLTDQSVTIRHRDTMVQERVAIENCQRYLAEKLLA